MLHTTHNGEPILITVSEQAGIVYMGDRLSRSFEVATVRMMRQADDCVSFSFPRLADAWEPLLHLLQEQRLPPSCIWLYEQNCDLGTLMKSGFKLLGVSEDVVTAMLEAAWAARPKMTPAGEQWLLGQFTKAFPESQQIEATLAKGRTRSEIIDYSTPLMQTRPEGLTWDQQRKAELRAEAKVTSFAPTQARPVFMSEVIESLQQRVKQEREMNFRLQCDLEEQKRITKNVLDRLGVTHRQIEQLDKIYRFFCGLQIQDQPTVVQREYVSSISRFREILRFFFAPMGLAGGRTDDPSKTLHKRVPI